MIFVQNTPSDGAGYCPVSNTGAMRMEQIVICTASTLSLSTLRMTRCVIRYIAYNKAIDKDQMTSIRDPWANISTLIRAMPNATFFIRVSSSLRIKYAPTVVNNGQTMYANAADCTLM